MRREYTITDEQLFKYLDEVRFDVRRKGIDYLLLDFIEWRDGELIGIHEIEVLMYHWRLKIFQVIVLRKNETP